MNLKKSLYDVTGIGSALLDFTVESDENILKEFSLRKGEMHLIDAERSREILGLLKGMNIHVSPGGSCANTIAGLSKLGGKGCLIGKVAEDENGRIYIEKTLETGVASYITKGGGITGHAITFITSDFERTFATHLGAAIELSVDEIDYSAVAASSILHLEGYLFEPDNLRSVCYRAMEKAKENGVLISLDLSDPALVGRVRNVFTEVSRDFADIIFVNEEEASAFTGTEGIDALEIISEYTRVAVVKLGEKGSIIKSGRDIYRIDAVKTDVVNTNGAGDMYAAGFLYGITSGRDIGLSGRIASYAASLAVASAGARVEADIDLQRII